MRASRLPVLLVLCALPWSGVARAQLPEPSFITTSDGVRLAYRRMGSGRPLLVLHGGPGLGMGSLIADLAPLARDHELVFFDQRGAGHSEPGDTAAATFERHVQDVDDVVQRLALEKVVVLGHSWGAALAALYAAAHPERVAGVVLMAPLFPRLQPWGATAAGRMRPDTALDRRIASYAARMANGPDPLAACREQAPLVLQRMVAPGAGRSAADLCDMPAATLRTRNVITRRTMVSLGAWDLRARAGAYRGPALVIHGVSDPLPEEAAREWGSVYRDGRVLVVKDAAHMPHVSAPDTVFAAIRALAAQATARP